MNLLLLALLLITGFVGCAEFASVALVHPVIRRLAPAGQLTMEKGLLRTYGLVMPLAMTAAPVLGGLAAVRWGGPWFVSSALVLTAALIVTIFGNVPINLWTLRLDEAEVPPRFGERRRLWDAYQAVRGSLQLIGFSLVALGTSELLGAH